MVEEIELISQNHSFRPWKQQQLPSPTARGIQSPEHLFQKADAIKFDDNIPTNHIDVRWSDVTATGENL